MSKIHFGMKLIYAKISSLVFDQSDTTVAWRRSSCCLWHGIPPARFRKSLQSRAQQRATWKCPFIAYSYSVSWNKYCVKTDFLVATTLHLSSQFAIFPYLKCYLTAKENFCLSPGLMLGSSRGLFAFASLSYHKQQYFIEPSLSRFNMDLQQEPHKQMFSPSVYIIW